jgi:hypothetical protein
VGWLTSRVSRAVACGIAAGGLLGPYPT